MPEHVYAGTRQRDGESVHVCGCGEFEHYNKSEVLAHLMSMNELESLPAEHTPYEEFLERVYLDRLDSRANTR